MASAFSRSEALDTVRRESSLWDLIIIGGGASGVGVAVDAATRGFRTLLVEQSDFGKGTSSRSTKLIHGGVRYLRSGEVSLVRESLHERAQLLKNAAHLVQPLPFVVPTYHWWEQWYYGIGLKVYDWLSGSARVGRSRMLSRQQTTERFPGLQTDELSGGVLYYDAQFDDARLTLNLAQTAAEAGATLLNYVRVDELLHDETGRLNSVRMVDVESGETLTASGRVVVNATGIFTDQVRHLDDKKQPPVMRLSQGIHLVLDAGVLGGETALMIPKTSDGRLLFAIPWQGQVVLGTTDTPVAEPDLEPRALEDEIQFLLEHGSLYFRTQLTVHDVKSVFAGIRPLVSKEGQTATSALSRKHRVIRSPSGLVTLTGGKWTTYRKMAEDAVDAAIKSAELEERPCVTDGLPIHGCSSDPLSSADWLGYGSDGVQLDAIVNENKALNDLIHPRLSVRGAQVVWAVRGEMARTIDDILSRRTRALLRDAEAAIEAAPRVAQLMSSELGCDEAWIEKQVSEFRRVARDYQLGHSRERSSTT